MKTAFLLLAQYDARAIIPIEWVCRDYLTHLTPQQLIRKATTGGIALPIVRLESSQKSAKGVHLADLAQYLDGRRELALKELMQINREASR